jgi:hypothetical protein
MLGKTAAVTMKNILTVATSTAQPYLTMKSILTVAISPAQPNLAMKDTLSSDQSHSIGVKQLL